ncbi:MAG: aminoacyl-tRNA hydrolase [Deltaproteobacteria bacterium]|nr:aminoacyl-tRNA hydrolase [Deltaproteobacteria bacterium]
MSDLKIVIGLGNPGEKYRNTRHNAGYMALAVLAEKKGFNDPCRSKKALISKGKVEGYPVILAWPTVYMNLSGSAAAELLNFYKVPLERLLVIHDDMDLPVGRLKACSGGGSAGHNGLVSLMEEIGEGFDRLRIGIGRPDRAAFGGDWSPYVLAPFNSLEVEAFDQSLQTAALASAAWISHGLPTCQRRANVRPPKPPKEGQPGGPSEAGSPEPGRLEVPEGRTD